MSLHSSCVQRCKLHWLHTSYFLGLIYTCFHKDRCGFNTFDMTLLEMKITHVLAVRTAYEHIPLHLGLKHISNSNINHCEQTQCGAKKLMSGQPQRVITEGNNATIRHSQSSFSCLEPGKSDQLVSSVLTQTAQQDQESQINLKTQS